MSLTPGTRIGAYEIAARIGVGGMGEVYRATDTSLKRQVAIKVLPEAVAADADRLARFRREAEVLASLNHPNVAAIHGLENSDGRTALVMELVEGSTLADRIERGPVPIDEALAIARQIAEALEAAHEQGIIHRDLKPANVKVRADGTVKVLDFGLAKAMEPAPALRPSTEEAVTRSPTITAAAMTQAGTILGTAAYMSPEQASGKAVDRRTDIWAFGCVLYEMLTGRRAFDGATSLEVMAAVLERDVDWTTLPPTTPARVRTVLRRALDKDPRRRLHDIADARIELDDHTQDQPDVPTQPGGITTRWLAALVVTAIAASVAAGSLAWYVKPTPGEASGATHVELVSEIPMRAGRWGALALSPDGRRVAYAATSENNGRSLYIRDLDRFEARAIPDTDGAISPAFSPDGNWIAFEADGQIKKVGVAGGIAVPLCDACGGEDGLSWESNDSILFSQTTSGIWRVPARGGAPSVVTTLRPGEFSHTFPQILPGRKALLYSSSPNGMLTPRIFVESLESGDREEVGRGAGARYLPSGHLVYTQSGRLMAVPFDVERLEPRGDPTVVLQGIQEAPFGASQIAYSNGGSIAYLPATGGNQQTLVWVDAATGHAEPVASLGHNSWMPRLAPDQRRILVITDGDVWLYDVTRGDGSRLTFDGENSYPVWAPDGTRFAYRSEGTDPPELIIMTLDSSTPKQKVSTDQGADIPLSWSPDPRFLAAVAVTSDTYNDIWVHTLDASGGAMPFRNSTFREGAPTFSTDGRWIAFTSNQSGRPAPDVYMAPFPGPGQERPVSIGGGNEPVWAPQAPLLFYRQDDTMMVVEITTEPTVDIGMPRPLFTGSYDQTNASWPNYDVTPDGKRLLMIKRDAQEASTRINLVLDWFEELRRSVPVE